MDREELQNRRAVNQIWNGAGRYDVQPERPPSTRRATRSCI